MFFKRKKLNDYLNDEQFVKELEQIKKSKQTAENFNPPPEQSPKQTVETVVPAAEDFKPAVEEEMSVASTEICEPALETVSEQADEPVIEQTVTAVEEIIVSVEQPEQQAEEIVAEDLIVPVKADDPVIVEVSEPEEPAAEIPAEPEYTPKNIPVLNIVRSEPQTHSEIKIASVEKTEAAGGLSFTTTRSLAPDIESIIRPAVVPAADQLNSSSAEKKAERSSFFGRLKTSLAKTKNNIVGKISWIMSSKTKIDDEVLDELEEALYTSDIGVKTSELIMKNIRSSVKEQRYTETSELKNIIRTEISALVKADHGLANAEFKDSPHVVLVVGVNGNGKTTTIGKLAHYYRNMGKKVIIGAADTFRAAAIEQLETWAERAGCEVVKQQMGADPAAVAYNAYEAAIARNADILLIDTAGRLHNKVNLMNELEKISRVLKKFNPAAPHDVLLVLDATTGQNALSQARIFSESTGVTGLILTKLDGTAKGGVAIAINQELDMPVKFIGVGEKIDDLSVFDINEYVQAIFD